MSRYSAWRVFTNGLIGQRGWRRTWRDAAPKESYDIIIVGGGLHGLATAYYLAANHGARNIAVLEKGWLGGVHFLRIIARLFFAHITARPAPRYNRTVTVLAP